MKKNIFRSLICVVLVLVLTISAYVPVASAASASKILRVNADHVRLHYTAAGQGDTNMITLLRKGTRVLYLGTSHKVWVHVRTEKGLEGYIYKDYLSAYGAVSTKSLYVVKSKATAYKRSNGKYKKTTSLSAGTIVSVKSTRGNYAYVQTMTGRKVYIKKSVLTKYN